MKHGRFYWEQFGQSSVDREKTCWKKFYWLTMPAREASFDSILTITLKRYQWQLEFFVSRNEKVWFPQDCWVLEQQPVKFSPSSMLIASAQLAGSSHFLNESKRIRKLPSVQSLTSSQTIISATSKALTFTGVHLTGSFTSGGLC